MENSSITDKKVIQNKASEMKQGAGPLEASTFKDNGVCFFLAFDIGPGATSVLGAIGVKIGGIMKNENVKDAVERYLGQL